MMAPGGILQVRKIAFLFVIFTAGNILNAAELGSAELVANGGFEQGLTGWGHPPDSPHITLIDDAHTGDKAVRIDATTGNGGAPPTDQQIAMAIPVEPRGIYRVAAWARQTAGIFPYKVTLGWLDEAGTELGYDNDWRGTGRPQDWTLHEGTATAPPAAAQCVIYVGVRAGNAAEFDDVSFKMVHRGVEPFMAISVTWLDANGKEIRTDARRTGHESNPLTWEQWQAIPNRLYEGKLDGAIRDWKLRGCNLERQNNEGDHQDAALTLTGVEASIFTNAKPIEPLQSYRLSVKGFSRWDSRATFVEQMVFSPAEARHVRVAVKIHKRNLQSFTLMEVALRRLADGFPPVAAKPADRPAEVWMCPDFRADPNPLFAPGAPWGETVRGLTGVKLHLRMLNDNDRLPETPIAPEFIKNWKLNIPQMVAFLKEHNLKLGLDTAGLDGSQGADTGQKTATAELHLINRIYAAGGTVDSIMMDGPISRVIKGGREAGNGGANATLNLSLEESVHELVEAFKTIHAEHPEIKIGLGVNFGWWGFEGHPAFMGGLSHTNLSGHEYNEVLDAVLAAMAKAGERVEFVTTELPVPYFTQTRSQFVAEPLDDAAKILALEKYCARKGLKFGAMYTSEARPNGVYFSNKVYANNVGRGVERRFYEEVLEALQLYRAYGGYPDQFVIESWFHFNQTLLPEDRGYSFTHLTRDFIRQLKEYYPSIDPVSSKSQPNPSH